MEVPLHAHIARKKQGCMSELNGEAGLQKDLYIRPIIDFAKAVADYKKSPVPAGINYYSWRNVVYLDTFLQL
jgi:hypothetical protein